MFPPCGPSPFRARLGLLFLAFLGVSLFSLAPAARSQTIAFPGALGFGAYTTGGRNGTVYHVTTLADSGPGSFRDAVSSSSRTIVFDVGGTIKLLTAVSAKGNLTIAGQTAPGGIKFDGGEISFSSRSNIICRFIRIRPGSDTASSTDDAIAFADGRAMIFDHCSIAFAPWNNVGAVSTAWQTTPVTDITFQHCINANPTGQQFGAHTESVSSDWTWCYNIFANSHNRNPLAKVNNVFINNIEYNNSAGYTTHTSTKFKHDIVNNYFVWGPASGGNFPWYQMDNNQSIYFTGNLNDSDKNGILGGSTTAPLPGYQGGGTILSAPWSSWTSIIPTMSPALAWRYGISAAGAFPRDEVDALVISQMKTLGSGTTGTGSGTAGPDGGLYTSQTQTGLGNNGYGTLAGLAALTDADNDGMPDYWELATGSNPNAANPLTNTLTGYTLLENYLNYLAAPHAATRSNTPVTVNLRQFADGFAASATFSLTNATNGTVSLINGTNAVFTPTANFSGLGSFNFNVTEGSYSLIAAVTVCVPPVAPPSSTAAFNGTLIGVTVATASVPQPANLIWRGDGFSNVWNTTASNWFNGTRLAAFKNNDVATLDDTGSNTPAILVSGALSPGALLFSHRRDYTITGSGSWSGSGSLIKSGTGTLSIGTTNSLSGTVNIRDGKVSLSSGANLGSGSIVLADGSTFEVQGGGSGSTISGPITVSPGDSVTISSGQLSTSFNGAVSTSSTNSVLNVSNSVSFAGAPASQFGGFLGTIQIQPNATLRFVSTTNGTTFGALVPSFTVNGTVKPRMGGSTLLLGSISGAGTLTGQEKDAVNGGVGNVLYNIGGNNTDSTFTGTLTDALINTNPTCLIKTGTGRLTLTGNNTFTGTNTVAAGMLLINGALTPSLTTVYTSATLGGSGVITNPVTIRSGGILAPGAHGAGSIGTLTIAGHLTNAAPAMCFDLSASPTGPNDRIHLSGTLAMSGAQNFYFNLTEFALSAGTYGLIEGATNSTASSISLVHNLPSSTRQTFSLVCPPAGSNPSYVRLVVAGNAASLVWRGTQGANWDTSTVNWANGSTPDTFYNLDAVLFDDTGSNAANVTLPAPVSPASITVNSSQNYTFSGSPLTGGGALTKLGSSTLTIANTNSSFAGGVSIFGGTLVLGSGSSIGSSSMTLSNNGTFSLPLSGAAVYYGGSITVAPNTAGNLTAGGLAYNISGPLYSGNTNSTLNIISGVSFSGTTSAQFDNFHGTLHIPFSSALRYSSDSTGNTFGSLSPVMQVDGTLQPRDAGNTVQIGTLTGSGTLAGPQSNAGSGDTLYILGGNHSDSLFNGNISSNSAVAGSETGATKTGNGKLTLGGASTFTGGLTVESGTLCVNTPAGSGTGTGDLEIFTGATLSGAGIIGSATTLDGGATLAPGDPFGALTFTNSLTLNESSVLKFDLGASSDCVVVGGNLVLAGLLQVTNTAGFGAGTYTLFTSSGSLNLGNFVLTTAPAGYQYSFNTNTPGTVKLVVSIDAPPTFGNIRLDGSQLIFSGSNGTPFLNYYVLAATNLTTPLTNWLRIATNQFDANGGFLFTNAIGNGATQNFYRLQQ